MKVHHGLIAWPITGTTVRSAKRGQHAQHQREEQPNRQLSGKSLLAASPHTTQVDAEFGERGRHIPSIDMSVANDAEHKSDGFARLARCALDGARKRNPLVDLIDDAPQPLTDRDRAVTRDQAERTGAGRTRGERKNEHVEDVGYMVMIGRRCPVATNEGKPALATLRSQRGRRRVGRSLETCRSDGQPHGREPEHGQSRSSEQAPSSERRARQSWSV